MNPVEQFISERHMKPIDVMNILQAYGIVSDLAVTPADIADEDCDKAVRWLRVQFEEKML